MVEDKQLCSAPAQPLRDIAADVVSGYTIAAVDRALALLEVLGRVGPASLSLVAGEAGCTRTAAFRLLRTLEARSFVAQDGPRGMWRLGGRLTALRETAADQGALAATAAPVLAALAAATGEVVYLFHRRGLERETLAIHQPDPRLRRYDDVGTREALHAGPGRLLLATAPEAVQTQVLSARLPRYTPATVVDPKRIAEDLVRLRARGWLITESEVEPGAVSISAPVRDTSGRVVALVSIFAPLLRMRPPRPRTQLPSVLRAAQDISRLLGWRGTAMAETASASGLS